MNYKGSDSTTNSGMRAMFLPPYSPNFNPIELAFSAIKACIKRDNDPILNSMRDDHDDEAEVYAYLSMAVWSVTVADTEGWFCHCNYIV